MDPLLERLDQARARLEAKDETRDEMLNAKRGLTSRSRSIVNRVHQHELEEARASYKHLLDDVAKVRSLVEDHPDLWSSGALRNALQEVAEAWAVLNLSGEPVDLPEEHITDPALVLGLGDAVGEIRRIALDALIQDRTEDAVERLRQMETLLEALVTIDVSSGIVDHRHKVDVARGLVDKTRGKIALARIESRIADRIGEDLEDAHHG